MTETPSRSRWALIRRALRGGEYQHTEGPLRTAVVLLAIPMVLEMMMEGIFAVADIFYVSHLGTAAVAAVGLTESILAIVYALAMGLGTGVAAVVARRIGEENRDGAAHAAAQGVLLALAVGLLLGTLGVTFAPTLLRQMGADPEVLAVGTSYARIMLGGEATIILLFLLNAAFRGAGDPAIAMRVLVVANGVNIVLAPVLIFVFQWGVAGAAIATTIGRAVGVVLALRALRHPAGRIPIRWRHFRPDLGILRTVVRLAGNTTLQFLVTTVSWVGLTRIMALFGSDALAGYTVAMRLVTFAILPAFGLASAAATLVGQSLGARNADRANEAVWITCRLNAMVLGGVALLFVIGAPTMASWFGTDPEMTRHATRVLRIVSLGFPFYAVGMVVTSAFNGAGDVWTPTWLSFVIFWLWEIPLAWFLAKPMGMGPDGVSIAIAVSFSTLAVVATLLFRRGQWRSTVV